MKVQPMESMIKTCRERADETLIHLERTVLACCREHPMIVNLEYAFTSDRYAFLALEYVEGKNINLLNWHYFLNFLLSVKCQTNHISTSFLEQRNLFVFCYGRWNYVAANFKQPRQAFAFWSVQNIYSWNCFSFEFYAYKGHYLSGLEGDTFSPFCWCTLFMLNYQNIQIF